MVTKAIQPSTSPATSGAGSNCTGTAFTDAGSRLLAASRTAQGVWLEAATPIFLPTMSLGPSRGLLANDMMQNAFFWYWAPMILSAPPSVTAAAVMSGAEMPTWHLFCSRSASTGVALGPPGRSLEAANPSWVK